MKHELVWTWAAEADLQRFFAEAEDVREGKGMELLTQVETASALLVQFPRMPPNWRFPVRRLMIRRRQLALFYVPESRGIVIIGVADPRRDPEAWWDELRSRMS
ncbi:type II toxin-antitoxin system RelE/ParE family toxin [Prosthecobacter sp.]|uniref:type II toxin-antitoxin system RelE/ParE family toxin n=1 Tax=Prosthecobacter sp. TaxID=1965333 RepID=UPI003782E67E